MTLSEVGHIHSHKKKVAAWQQKPVQFKRNLKRTCDALTRNEKLIFTCEKNQTEHKTVSNYQVFSQSSLI